MIRVGSIFRVVTADQVSEIARAKIPSWRRLTPLARVSRTLQALPKIVRHDEKLVTLAAGGYEGRDGVIAVTNQRAIVVARRGVSQHVESFEADQITSVQSERGVVRGKVILTVAGNRAVIYAIFPPDRAEEISYAVRAHLTRKPVPPAEPPQALAAQAPPAPAGGSVGEELGRMAALRDRGVLSDSEFEDQKRKLLDA